MSQEHVEVMRRLFDGFNEFNAEAVREIWTADAEWRPAFTGGGLVEGAVYRGYQGLSEYLAIQGDTWESLVADLVTIRSVGDRCLVEVRLRAVGRGSGVPVERTTWNVFELRSGKVAAGRVYTNEQEALKAAGLRE